MNINIEKQGAKLYVAPEGRLDTTTAPELENAIMTNLNGVTDMVLDLDKLIYMASAGLRVVLTSQKKMNAVGGNMVVRNVNEMIMEVFEATGFVDILTIE